MATKTFVVRNGSTFAPEAGVTVTHDAVGGYLTGVTDASGSVTLSGVGLPMTGGVVRLEKSGFRSDTDTVPHGGTVNIFPGAGWLRATSSTPAAMLDMPLRQINAITSNLEGTTSYDFDITFTDLVYGGDYSFTANLLSGPTNPWPSPGSIPQSYYSWVLTVRTDLNPSSPHPPTPQTVYGFAYLGLDAYPYHRVFVTFNSGQIPEPPPDPGTGGEQPFNLRSHFGWYYRSFIRSGDAYVSRARARPTPPFDLTTRVSLTENANRPVLAEDMRERLHCLWATDTPAVFGAESNDDSATWSDPVSLFANGAFPIVRQDPASGALLAAARVGTALQTRIRYPGDDDWRAAVTLEDGGGALAIAEEAFGMEWMGDGQGRVVFAVRLNGETTIREYVSFDDGATCAEVT